MRRKLINHFLIRYGYTAVFLGIFLEDFGLPVPGETLLIGGSILAANGHFNIFILASLGILAGFLGDNIGYGIGYWGRRTLVLRYGRFFFLDESRLVQLEKFFSIHGNKIVTVARFIAGLRQFNGIIAGIAKMPWVEFLIFNFLGSLIWVSFWSMLAYFLGNKLLYMIQGLHLHLYFYMIVIVLAGLIVFNKIRSRS